LTCPGLARTIQPVNINNQQQGRDFPKTFPGVSKTVTGKQKRKAPKGQVRKQRNRMKLSGTRDPLLFSSGKVQAGYETCNDHRRGNPSTRLPGKMAK
jgi:hypothetical protein